MSSAATTGRSPHRPAPPEPTSVPPAPARPRKPAAAATEPQPRPATDYSDYQLVPARHPWRWVGTALVALGVVAVAWSLATNPRWEWGVVAQWFTAQSVVNGLVETLKLTAISGSARLRPRLHPGPDAALRLAAAGLGVLDLLLDFPLHAAAGADAALVQPRLPLREDQPGDPVHGRPLLRGPDHHTDQPVCGSSARPDPEPGGVLGRDHPRRHPVGGPGPARSSCRPGHSRLAPLHQDRPAAGHAGHPAHGLQRDHRPGQGHVDRLRPGLLRALLHRPGHLQPHPAGPARCCSWPPSGTW